MRTGFLFTFSAALLIYSCTATISTDNGNVSESASSAGSTSGYDSLKASNYGADDYGMKKFVMAFLKRGPNRDLDSARAAELQTAHLRNINRMAEEGTLVLAGPFFGDSDLRGIYVFDVQTIQEAEALTNTDPAIQEGSLVMELREWYGSAALLEIGKIHKTISKEKIVAD